MKKTFFYIILFICFIIPATYVFAFYASNDESEGMEENDNLALIIAHRGAVDQFNEHTIEAYEQSIIDGADWVEIDIRMTSDGVLVPMHDVDIDRTTTGNGKVNDLTWQQLSNYKTVGEDHHAPIPSLEEVFQTFGKRMHYYLETRSVNGEFLVEEKLISLLKKYDLLGEERVVIASFEKESLEKVKEMETSIPLVRLYRSGVFSLKDALKNEYEVIGLDSTFVNEEVVKALHDSGKKIHVFFNNRSKEKREQRRVQKLLVDGYITNDVGYTRNLLGR